MYERSVCVAGEERLCVCVSMCVCKREKERERVDRNGNDDGYVDDD